MQCPHWATRARSISPNYTLLGMPDEERLGCWSSSPFTATQLDRPVHACSPLSDFSNCCCLEFFNATKKYCLCSLHALTRDQGWAYLPYRRHLPMSHGKLTHRPMQKHAFPQDLLKGFIGKAALPAWTSRMLLALRVTIAWGRNCSEALSCAHSNSPVDCLHGFPSRLA